jgi:serine/threonine-protein kinase RsbW
MPFAGPYREVSLRHGTEVAPLLHDIANAMAGLGYSASDCMAVHLALDEAVTNGLRHGNGGDPAKRVLVRFQIKPDEVLADVEDEGAGFEPDVVPDPTDPISLERPSGRGLLLMRHFMTSVRFSERGNRVTLTKRRSG